MAQLNCCLTAIQAIPPLQTLQEEVQYFLRMWLGYFLLTFVRNMVIGSWLHYFFIVVKRVLHADMDESIAFENCSERTM